jgi:hypothetical protein
MSTLIVRVLLLPPMVPNKKCTGPNWIDLSHGVSPAFSTSRGIRLQLGISIQHIKQYLEYIFYTCVSYAQSPS